MAGKRKKQGAGAAKQSGADHPDSHDIELPATEEFFRDSTGEKTPASRSDSGPAQAVIVLTRRDDLQESGKNITVRLMEGVVAFDTMQPALCGNGSKFSLDLISGKRAVKDVDKEQLRAGKGGGHLYGVTGNPVCVD